MHSSLMPVQRAGLGEQVVRNLREAIVQGDLAVGTHLVEDAMAAQFGVSRGPVRDALRELEAEGLVRTRRRGAFVVGIDSDDIDELYSLRGAVESLAARLAMGREEVDWQASERLVERMHEMAAAGNAEVFAEADIAFHSLIYENSGHRRLLDVWRQYEAILACLLRRTVLLDIDLVESAGKHETLLNLLKSDSPDQMLAELADHLEGSRRRMLRAHRSSGTEEPIDLP